MMEPRMVRLDKTFDPPHYDSTPVVACDLRVPVARRVARIKRPPAVITLGLAPIIVKR
jgi:hypothetical protein